MYILITGVAGFIGSHIAKRFIDEGFKVIGIDNLSSGKVTIVPKGVDFYNLDLVNSYKISQNSCSGGRKMIKTPLLPYKSSSGDRKMP